MNSLGTRTHRANRLLDENSKQATARLNHFLEHMDKTAPEGEMRTAVRLGTDEDGEPFGIIVWRKP